MIIIFSFQINVNKEYILFYFILVNKDEKEEEIFWLEMQGEKFYVLFFWNVNLQF